MNIAELSDKKILIVGYGVEGKATESFLKKTFPTAVYGVADKALDPQYLQKQKEYDIAIKTPGIPKNLVTIPYTTATNIFFATCKGITIGVTGSKGKSTTSSLIYHILKTAKRTAYLGGNIGTPLLDVLEKHNSSDALYVCELSSYQTEDIQFSPHISVMTSLFPEHMNYHGSVDAYYNAKKNLLAHVKNDDYFVYNPEYSRLKTWASELHCKTIPYETTLPLDRNEIPLLGAHNISNVQAAVTVAHILGISPEQIVQAIKSFTPLKHRLQKVGTFKGITFYDDAISTAPESTIAAIEAVPQVDSILLGGQDRGYDFSALVNLLAQCKISHLILFPESGQKIESLVKKYSDYKPDIFHATSMQEAVTYVFAHATPETVCLLSTASPSYSIWKNFEEKGDEFQLWVTKLGSL